MIALPGVLKAAMQMLEIEPAEMLRLLVALHRGKMLNDVDHLWKTNLAEWVYQKLVSWEKGEGSVVQLDAILAFSDMIPLMRQHLVRIIEAMLDWPDPKEDHRVSWANSAHVLASCMHALAERIKETPEIQIDLDLWSQRCVEKYYWSDAVLGGLVELIRER